MIKLHEHLKTSNIKIKQYREKELLIINLLYLAIGPHFALSDDNM